MAYFENLAWWQVLLGALVFAWLVQAWGTLRQTRHYQAVMGDISRRFRNGFLGAGNARGSLGRGVIAVVVASEDGVVRKVLVMEGRSVFAKFRANEDFVGLNVPEMRERLLGAKDGRSKALERALEQIEKTRQNRRDGLGSPA